MREDEIAYTYRRYVEASQQARSYLKSEQAKADSLKNQRTKSQSELQACGASKINLEKRLEDVQKIIHTLDTSVETAITEANRSSKKAEEWYTAVIHCVGIPGASIQAMYMTKTVGEDDDTAAAYRLCRKEEQRLRDGIEELRARMSALEDAIASMGMDISKAERNIQYYESQIRVCEGRAHDLHRRMRAVGV